MPSMQTENKCKVQYIIKKELERTFFIAQETVIRFVLLIVEMTVISYVVFQFYSRAEKLSLEGQKYKNFWNNEISRCWFVKTQNK